jgi:hypothetical protein
MKIKALQDDFVKLKEDFDRAVHVETLRSVRKTGKFPYYVNNKSRH